MDQKKNGKITFKEFLMWLSSLSHGSLTDKIAWTFRLYDANEDGSICRDDLHSIIRAIYLLMGRKREADDELIKRKADLFFQVSLLSCHPAYTRIGLPLRRRPWPLPGASFADLSIRRPSACSCAESLSPNSLSHFALTPASHCPGVQR